MHGIGEFTWADGSIYDGHWVDGNKHGHGQYNEIDGSIYIGEWN